VQRIKCPLPKEALDYRKRGRDVKVASEIKREEIIGNVLILDTRRRVGREVRMRREGLEEVVVLVV